MFILLHEYDWYYLNGFSSSKDNELTSFAEVKRKNISDNYAEILNLI